MKKVSIIMPCYNCESTVVKALDSIPLCEDVEVLCIDDGSTDNTLEVLKNYKRLPLRIFENKINKGVGYSRNVGFDNAEGEYLYACDSDDTINSEAFLNCLRHLDGTKVIHIKIRLNNGNVWKYEPGRGHYVAFHTKFIKRDFLGDIRCPLTRCGEEDFVMTSLRNKPGFTEKALDLIVYNYNYPKEGSLSDRRQKKMNQNPIDIVVTYLDSSNKEWQDDFNYWKSKEGTANDPGQSYNPERFREWDVFKYWFRGVEKNCPWVRYVWLVVRDDNHIPSWINRNYKKLRVIHHEDYIPKELLPTFNSNVIECYLPFINDLSDNYILCNDDTYFLNPSEERHFFVNDKPVQTGVTENTYILKWKDTFCQTLNNNMRFIIDKYGAKKVAKHYHMQVPYCKTFCKNIINENYNDFLTRFKVSHFRHQNNYMHWLFQDLQEILGARYVDPDLYSDGCYQQILTTKTDWNMISKFRICCINDTNHMDNFEVCKRNQINFFESKFPEKSEYEN